MVNYLCRTKVVVPSLSASRGHGRVRRYSFGDVVALRLVAKLSAAGASVLRLKDAMQRLRSAHPTITLTTLPATHVLTNGLDIYLHRPGDPIERILDGQYAFGFLVELAIIRQEVTDAMKRPEPAPPRRRGRAA